MLKNKAVFMIIIVFLLLSCSKRIIRFEYDPNCRGYRVTVDYRLNDGSRTYIARLADGEKITDLKDISTYFNKFNEDSFEQDIAVNWGINERDIFTISTYYYQGLNALKEGRYQEAAVDFEKAAAVDKNIGKFSDIYYLTAKAYYYAGEKERAKEYFTRFIKYSDSITYSGMYNKLEDEGNVQLKELMDDAEKFLKDNSADSGLELVFQTHTEVYSAKYRNRGYKPGFTYHNKPEKFLFSYISDISEGIGIAALFQLNLNDQFNLITYYSYQEYLQKFFIGIPYQIYVDRKEQIGVKFTPGISFSRYKFHGMDEIKDFKKSLMNYSMELSIGYYLNQYILTYTGYQYFFYNKSNPYRFDHDVYKIEWYNDNKYYIGSTFYFYQDLGVSIEYNTGDAVTALNMFYIGSGYNWTEKEWFIRFYLVN